VKITLPSAVRELEVDGASVALKVTACPSVGAAGSAETETVVAILLTVTLAGAAVWLPRKFPSPP
jgi:hypothetical protein